MADSAVAVTAGSGTNIDTRTEGTNGNHRQVVVVGDPATNAGVAPVDATAGLKVDLGADNDVTVTGTVSVTGVVADDADFTDGTTVGMPAMGVYESTPSSVTDGDIGMLSITSTRRLRVYSDEVPSQGQATMAASVPVVIASNQTDVPVNPKPATSGGLTIFRSIDLDESEEEVKATAGQVYGMWVSNTATSTRFLKFYNATAANVTVGTTTPVLTIAIPGNSSDDITGFFSSAHGIAFGTAITVAATTGVADNDTGAPGANEVIVNIFYS